MKAKHQKYQENLKWKSYTKHSNKNLKQTNKQNFQIWFQDKAESEYVVFFLFKKQISVNPPRLQLHLNPSRLKNGK